MDNGLVKGVIKESIRGRGFVREVMPSIIFVDGCAIGYLCLKYIGGVSIT